MHMRPTFLLPPESNIRTSLYWSASEDSESSSKARDFARRPDQETWTDPGRLALRAAHERYAARPVPRTGASVFQGREAPRLRRDAAAGGWRRGFRLGTGPIGPSRARDAALRAPPDKLVSRSGLGSQMSGARAQDRASCGVRRVAACAGLPSRGRARSLRPPHDGRGEALSLSLSNEVAAGCRLRTRASRTQDSSRALASESRDRETSGLEKD